MATIALYTNKINRMPGLIKDVKKTVADYKSELSALKAKSLTINKSVCNLDDIISSIQTSSQTQEQKITSLDTFNHNSEEFISDAARIDGDAADIIKKRKDDFYDKYNYLKPECEKSGWEKFCNGCESVGEWCKEHWVTIVTVLVVIAIAVIAVVTFGVAIAAIAAIAGIASLVLCAADVICMSATGGKDLATVFRENGWNVLADIFQGISIGCDIVSIVLPAGAAIKAMAKVGIKTFAMASLEAVKIAYRGAIDDVFKSGFKNGMKNLGKMAFKTFIFDIDDLTKVGKGGKRVFDIWEPTVIPKDAPVTPNKHWTVDGAQLIPKSGTTPGLSNPNKLSMDDIMENHGYDSIPRMENGNPDISRIQLDEVNIKGMTDQRLNTKDINGNTVKGNFAKADDALKIKTKPGFTIADIEKQTGLKLTWHEDINLKTMRIVPSDIHNNLRHVGGVGNYNFVTGRIPDQFNNILENIAKFSLRNTVNSPAH
ncbi:hypothetical protein CLHUN_40890 [Ruminiclostridium hungatei]|uniref:Uncharacterized protein n=1 Tax=Ruminiclostridium hungatei TaxID=48256 RepID=A0A1V4SDV0_RUMHU|nr:HNH endonuclease [Ruminiclostridium hungatei]OPX42030.1 hypothetical protein CLHUN_40890 [Ruminiclostridium hungatei]